MTVENKKNNKALVVDVSSLNPLYFSLSNNHFTSDLINNFIKKSNIDLFYDDSCYDEFNYNWNNQGSLFIESPIKANEAIYLSDVGNLYSSSDNINQPKISSLKTEFSESVQQTLWGNSFSYKHLSEEDKQIIQTAQQLQTKYSWTAVFSNDWHLKNQCISYEGVDTYGTCSMLAGMVLSNFITYQKGTFIYHKWLNEDFKWIPFNRIFKKALSFKEVLDIERKRIDNDKSFWIKK